MSQERRLLVCPVRVVWWAPCRVPSSVGGQLSSLSAQQLHCLHPAMEHIIMIMMHGLRHTQRPTTRRDHVAALNHKTWEWAREPFANLFAQLIELLLNIGIWKTSWERSKTVSRSRFIDCGSETFWCWIRGSFILEHERFFKRKLQLKIKASQKLKVSSNIYGTKKFFAKHPKTDELKHFDTLKSPVKNAVYTRQTNNHIYLDILGLKNV